MDCARSSSFTTKPRLSANQSLRDDCIHRAGSLRAHGEQAVPTGIDSIEQVSRHLLQLAEHEARQALAGRPDWLGLMGRCNTRQDYAESYVQIPSGVSYVSEA